MLQNPISLQEQKSSKKIADETLQERLLENLQPQMPQKPLQEQKSLKKMACETLQGSRRISTQYSSSSPISLQEQKSSKKIAYETFQNLPAANASKPKTTNQTKHKPTQSGKDTKFKLLLQVSVKQI